MALPCGERHVAANPPLTGRDDPHSAMSRRTASLTVASLVLVALVCVAIFVPMPYVVMSPGLTENTLGTVKGKPVIAVTGHKTYPTSGHLDLTTVSVTSPGSPSRLPDILAAWWSADEIVLPRDVVYPPEQSVQAVKKENEAAMLDSQSLAIAAGLAEAGIDSVSVTVHSVEDGAPADGVLRKGDEIVAVNGRRVDSSDDAVAAISGLAPGKRVKLMVSRDGEDRTVSVTTEASPDDETKARVGVQLSEDFDPPFDVKVTLGREIGGPSAGLIFALAIYDRITPGELTDGRYVAGTGTIDSAGAVGPIGGIQQKIAGASANGATIFLVPADNCAEAGQSPLADEIDLVKVATMDDAVAALRAYAEGTESTLTMCGS